MGHPQAAAVAALQRAGFGVNALQQPVSRAAGIGRVLRQVPAPGTAVPAGSVVTLVVGVRR